MAPLLHLLIIIFISLAPPPSTLASSPPLPPPPHALVSLITKDETTSLYTISLINKNHNSSFLLDLTSPFSWSLCPPSHPSVPCNSSACAAASAFPPPQCPRITRTNKNPCTCTVSPVNPITKACSFADLTLTNITISTTNGHNPTSPITIHNLISSCASKFLLRRLPSGTVGVAGLARSAAALQAQLSTALSIKQQFALCLPSTSTANGVAFFGDKPYYLLPPTLFEVGTILSYTPLFQHPMNRKDYYLNLHGIAVNGVAVGFLQRVLQFDSLGHGGVMLSTAVPYLKLRSHVHRPVMQAFAKATKKIRRAPAVKPFELCFNSSALGFTRVGYAVPQIDLILGGGKNWTLFGANSIKQVGPETACLAVVDGGPKAEQAVVIGGFQMENNLLVFDIEKKRLGFSSSLLFFRTTCGNFNFTNGV